MKEVILINITSFLVYCFIVTFSPGPANIVILSAVHSYGTKKAMKYTYGATLAFGLLLMVSAMLNTLLAAVIPRILIIMQITGSFYMLYLAYQIYNSDVSGATARPTASFRSGFLMQFLNPKVVLFTMTVIPGFIMPYYDTVPAVSVSVLAITVIGFLAFASWVIFGTIFKSFLQKHSRIVNVVMALFLVYAAVMIWL